MKDGKLVIVFVIFWIVVVFGIILFVSLKKDKPENPEDWYIDTYKKCVSFAYRGYDDIEDMKACNEIKKLNEL